MLVVENQVNGPKKKQIMWFQNNGLAYRCNYWSMDEKPDDKDSWAQFMSETNEVSFFLQFGDDNNVCLPRSALNTKHRRPIKIAIPSTLSNQKYGSLFARRVTIPFLN